MYFFNNVQKELWQVYTKKTSKTSIWNPPNSFILISIPSPKTSLNSMPLPPHHGMKDLAGALRVTSLTERVGEMIFYSTRIVLKTFLNEKWSPFLVIFCYKFFRSELFQNVEKYNNLYMSIQYSKKLLCCSWSVQSIFVESTCLQQFPFRHPHPRASDCSLCFTTVVLSFQQKWNFVGNDSIPPVLNYLSMPDWTLNIPESCLGCFIGLSYLKLRAHTWKLMIWRLFSGVFTVGSREGIFILYIISS